MRKRQLKRSQRISEHPLRPTHGGNCKCLIVHVFSYMGFFFFQLHFAIQALETGKMGGQIQGWNLRSDAERKLAKVVYHGKLIQKYSGSDGKKWNFPEPLRKEMLYFCLLPFFTALL